MQSPPRFGFIVHETDTMQVFEDATLYGPRQFYWQLKNQHVGFGPFRDIDSALQHYNHYITTPVVVKENVLYVDFKHKKRLYS